MKILIIGSFHHKNKIGLDMMLSYMNYEHKYGAIEDINNYDVVLMPVNCVDTSKYPNKKFIFGPHFSVFPTRKVLLINNVNKNSVYIQPSEWAVKVWRDMNVEQFVQLKIFSFPVDTNKFKPIQNDKTKVFVYFKRRKQGELEMVESFLTSKNIDYRVFDYVKRYDEGEYLNYLQKSKYGIIVGAHESQGFAIEEALSCGVPLLVWNISSMSQEEGSRYPQEIKATSIPYWDKRCGEYFYKKEEFQTKYGEFINKLNTYKPREFVLENLSVEKCVENFKKIL